MKQLVAKMFATFFVIALVMLFVSVALLVGARAVADAGSSVDELVFVGFVACGALASVVRNSGRAAEAIPGQTALRITSHSTRRRGEFVGVPSAN